MNKINVANFICDIFTFLAVHSRNPPDTVGVREHHDAPATASGLVLPAVRGVWAVECRNHA